jgi:molybdopterin-containing oxidoreductase family membrane subunit
MLVVGIVINVGMWIERFIIIPVSLNITRMPFTWRSYHPSIEIPLTIGTFALFMLLYMLASRLIPLVPVWEVQEGQSAHILRKVGKAVIPTVSNVD